MSRPEANPGGKLDDEADLGFLLSLTWLKALNGLGFRVYPNIT